MNHNCEICEKMKDLARHPFCIAFGIDPNDPRWEACEKAASSPEFRSQLEELHIMHTLSQDLDTTERHRFH